MRIPITLAALLLLACPVGTPGPKGDPGPAGPAGPAGTSGFARVLVVPASGTPVQNGTALRMAISTLSPMPSEANPWKVLLEPGEYDLGASSLQLNGIVLEGAGRTVTRVYATGLVGATVTISPSGTNSFSELHALQLGKRGASSSGQVLYRTGNGRMIIEDCEITANVDVPVANFVELNGGDVVIRDSEIGNVTGVAGTLGGIATLNGNALELDNVRVTVGSQMVTSATGVQLNGYSAKLVDTEITVFVGVNTMNMLGLWVLGGTAKVRGGSVTISGTTPASPPLARAVWLAAGTTGLESIDLTAPAVATGIDTTAVLQARNVAILGPTTSLRNGSTAVSNITHSVASGSFVRPGGGTLSCGLVITPGGTPVVCP